MDPQSHRWPTHALGTARTLAHHGRTLATAGGLTLLLGVAAVQALPQGGPAPGGRSLGSAVSATPVADGTEAMLRRHRCSATGFGGAATPRSAIVRDRDGDLRLVDFDRGYASFTGEAPGELIAVCLPAAR